MKYTNDIKWYTCIGIIQKYIIGKRFFKVYFGKMFKNINCEFKKVTN